MKKLKLVKPTPEEDAAIDKGIAADPDARELSDEEFKRLRRPRGRPKVESVKVLISLRLDPDVLAVVKATGSGWQSRINAVLRREYVDRPGVFASARKAVAREIARTRDALHRSLESKTVRTKASVKRTGVAKPAAKRATGKRRSGATRGRKSRSG